MDIATQRRMSPVAFAIEAVIGGAIGAGMGALYVTNAAEIRWADCLALIIALVCIIGGVRLFVESYDPAALARRLGVEGEATDKERRDQRIQALIAALFGVVLFWPPLATLNGGAAPAASYIVIGAFVAFQAWSAWRGEKSQDEYARVYVRQLSWGAFLIAQTALFAYAAAERMALVPPLTAWDILVMFTALSIVAPLVSMRGKINP